MTERERKTRWQRQRRAKARRNRAAVLVRSGIYAGPLRRGWGLVLRAHRRSYGFTQTELAAELGCGFRRLSAMEKGRRRPTLRELRMIESWGVMLRKV